MSHLGGTTSLQSTHPLVNDGLTLLKGMHSLPV